MTAPNTGSETYLASIGTDRTMLGDELAQVYYHARAAPIAVSENREIKTI